LIDSVTRDSELRRQVVNAAEEMYSLGFSHDYM
jgi:hypothetical protein